MRRCRAGRRTRGSSRTPRTWGWRPSTCPDVPARPASWASRWAATRRRASRWRPRSWRGRIPRACCSWRRRTTGSATRTRSARRARRGVEAARAARRAGHVRRRAHGARTPATATSRRATGRQRPDATRARSCASRRSRTAPPPSSFLAGGRHFWNSGIFAWRADVFLRGAGAPRTRTWRRVPADRRAADRGRWTRAAGRVLRAALHLRRLRRAGAIRARARGARALSLVRRGLVGRPGGALRRRTRPATSLEGDVLAVDAKGCFVRADGRLTAVVGARRPPRRRRARTRVLIAAKEPRPGREEGRRGPGARRPAGAAVRPRQARRRPGREDGLESRPTPGTPTGALRPGRLPAHPPPAPRRSSSRRSGAAHPARGLLDRSLQVVGRTRNPVRAGGQGRRMRHRYREGSGLARAGSGLRDARGTERPALRRARRRRWARGRDGDGAGGVGGACVPAPARGGARPAAETVGAGRSLPDRPEPRARRSCSRSCRGSGPRRRARSWSCASGRAPSAASRSSGDVRGIGPRTVRAAPRPGDRGDGGRWARAGRGTGEQPPWRTSDSRRCSSRTRS